MDSTQVDKHFQEVCNDVAFALSANTGGWDYLFANEKAELVLQVVNLMSASFEEGYEHAAEQYDGWRTCSNPYKKEPETNA